MFDESETKVSSVLRLLFRVTIDTIKLKKNPFVPSIELKTFVNESGTNFYFVPTVTTSCKGVLINLSD